MATAELLELMTAEEFGRRSDPGYPEELVRGESFPCRSLTEGMDMFAPTGNSRRFPRPREPILRIGSPLPGNQPPPCIRFPNVFD